MWHSLLYSRLHRYTSKTTGTLAGKILYHSVTVLPLPFPISSPKTGVVQAGFELVISLLCLLSLGVLRCALFFLEVSK